MYSETPLNMVIISDYTLTFNRRRGVFEVWSAAPMPPCPCCGGKLFYRDSRIRIRRREGGVKEYLLIRRLYCSDCHSYHNELPDCLVPHKHYDAETISGVLDEVVSPDDDDAEDYPCPATMRRWIYWFRGNLANIEGALRRAGHTALQLGDGILFAGQSLLDTMRGSFPDWLERVLRIIYNTGGTLPAIV